MAGCQMVEMWDGPPTPPRTLKGRSSLETRSAILDLIRSAKTISRVDLARRSALTEATISKIVKELLTSGVIVPAGFAESTGGKPAALLKLNDAGVHALGMTLDVSHCAIVLCGADGTEIARREIAGYGQEEPPRALARLAQEVLQLLDEQDVDRTSVSGLGLASGGRRPSERGWGSAVGISGQWEPFPVAQELQRLTGLTVIRENDADCAALGEYWTSPEPARDFVSVYMSYGIGCGIVINGAIYRGASGNAGEIGHTTVDPAGMTCWCGSLGCLETVASPRAIVREVLSVPHLRANLDVDDQTPFREVYRRFGELAATKDVVASSILDRAATQFAVAISNMVVTLDVDLVVLAGSGFAGVADVYQSALRKRLQQGAFVSDMHPVSVRLSAIGSETAALGAASVVLHRHLTPHRTLTTA